MSSRNTSNRPAPSKCRVTELLARVEAATGPSKALDVDVWIALGLWTPPKGGERSAVCVDRWKLGRLVHYCPHSPVTASLDAALALVERVLPGVMWQIGFDPDDGSMCARLVTVPPPFGHAKANHEIPALALLAAMLKALESRHLEAAPNAQVGPGSSSDV